MRRQREGAEGAGLFYRKVAGTQRFAKIFWVGACLDGFCSLALGRVVLIKKQKEPPSKIVWKSEVVCFGLNHPSRVRLPKQAIMGQALDRETLNQLSHVVISGAIEVHRQMGPGLLESIYQECLMAELRMRNVRVSQLVPVSLSYKSLLLDKAFIIDILVESEIIVELKSVEELLDVHEAQLLSYLKLTKKRLGLLINFNVPLLKNGIKRMVHNF